MLTAAIILAIPLAGIMWGVWELCGILSSGRVKITVYNRLEVRIIKPNEIEVRFENHNREVGQ